MDMEKKYKKYKINLPATDIDAYIRYPDYCHIYDRLWLAESQNFECGPLGILPTKFPVVVKPNINLYGMSKGFDIIKSKEEYINLCNTKHGLCWQKYLYGIQKNIDVVMYKGEIKYYNILHSLPHPTLIGAFLCHYPVNENIPNNVQLWISQNLDNYTGTLNIEFIHKYVTECHLRLNGDNYWYKEEFYEQLKNLKNFKSKEWGYYTDTDFGIIPKFDIKFDYTKYNVYDYTDTENNVQGENIRYGMYKCKMEDLKKFINDYNDYTSNT